MTFRIRCAICSAILLGPTAQSWIKQTISRILGCLPCMESALKSNVSIETTYSNLILIMDDAALRATSVRAETAIGIRGNAWAEEGMKLAQPIKIAMLASFVVWIWILQYLAANHSCKQVKPVEMITIARICMVALEFFWVQIRLIPQFAFLTIPSLMPLYSLGRLVKSVTWEIWGTWPRMRWFIMADFASLDLLIASKMKLRLA